MAEGQKVSMGVISLSIKGNADEASESIKKLTSNLGFLKSALNTVGTAAYGLGLKKIFSTLTDLVKKQSEYSQSLQTFKNIMGENYEIANEFANKMQDILGFDKKNVVDTMATFQRLGEGFGIASNDAYLMSKNLTQLAADMTTTGLSFDQASQKLKSGFAGEIEPMRAFGVALDKVTLQQTLYRLGIDRTYDSLTRAQKTELIYYQMMTQTANIQGSLAQQAVTPATAFRLVQTAMERLARSVGQFFTPIFMQLIPVILAVTQVLQRLAQKIADFFHINIAEDAQLISSSIGNISGGLGDVANGLENVGGKAKKANKELQKMLMPFDELNNVNFESNSGVGSIGSGLANLANGGSLGLPLPQYDLFENLTNQFQGDVDKIVAWIEKNIPRIVDAISAALTLTGHPKLAAVLELVTGIKQIWDAISDMQQNGINFDNATSAIEGLGRVIGAISLLSGNWKGTVVGFSLTWVTEAIEEIVRCWEFIQKGDWEGFWNNVDKTKMITGAIGAIGLIIVAIMKVKDIVKKSKGIEGTGKELEKVTQETKSVSDNTNSLSSRAKELAKTLGWGILIIGEVIVAGALIIGAIWGLGLALEQIGIAWQPVLDNEEVIVSALIRGVGILAIVGLTIYTLGETGKDLALKMGVGTLILLEVGVATGLFVAEIWAIGWGLGKVLEAWTPVLANGDLVLASIVAGTAILIAIAAATALLGVATVATGGILPLAIALGTLMLVELGAATLLFIDEIISIGIGLQQILIAWAPVLANGNAVEQAITWGTDLLIAIGGASAALGVASVASVGLLPLAIQLGTSMLQQLTDAVIDFIDHLSRIAREISQNLAPELKRLNSNLPETNENLNKYINFMKTFAKYTSDFTRATAVAGFSNAVKTIISWFTGSPIQNFANDVNKNYREVANLNNKLREANPELATAISLLITYFNFLRELDRLTGQNNTYKIASNMFINMREVGVNLVTGFVEGMRSQSWSLSNAVDSMLRNNLNSYSAYYEGLSFGYSIARGIGDAMRNSYFPTLISSVQTSSSVISVRFRAYADGGFPEDGQLFLANENGPELVGNIGNRTAVANNDQIVESLIAGVYQGTSKAFQENRGNQELTPYFEINLGNERLYDGYAKHKNQVSNKYGVRL